MSLGREYDWLKESQVETAEFLDDVLEYFQENEFKRAKEFEAWKNEKTRQSSSPPEW